MNKEDLVARNRALVASLRRSQKQEALLQLLPQGHGSGLDADLVDGLHAAEVIAKAKGVTAGGGGSTGGMRQHGNEWHEPDMAEAEHGHTESDITDLDHDAEKIRGKVVDDSGIGDGKVLTYKSGSDKIEYEAPAGGGDMLKSVYDQDENDKVDVSENSEKLEGSTKAEVQNHTPMSHDVNPDEGPHTGVLPLSKVEGHTKAVHDSLVIDAATLEGSNKAGVQDHSPKIHALSHGSGQPDEVTIVESQISDLDHDAQKIQGEDVHSASPTDGQMLVYSSANSRWEPADPLVTVQREGTATRVNTTSAGIIVAAPGAGKKLVLCGFVLSIDGNEDVQLRWNGASGSIIAELPTKGILAMNLIGVQEEGGENKNLYLTKGGSGNARGTVWTKEENV